MEEQTYAIIMVIITSYLFGPPTTGSSKNEQSSW